MGSDQTEEEQSFTPRLPLFSNPQSHAYLQSPQRPGTLTPPLFSLASVPFRWEEEPGKPRGCTSALSTLITHDFIPKCLEPPPSLLFLEANVSSNKLPSPTTVLDVPYLGKPRFQSSSFRMIRRECYGSFGGSCSPESGQLSTIVLGKKGIKDRGFLGSWRWGRRGFRSKREAGGVSCVFPSSMDRETEGSYKEKETSNNYKNVKITRIRRSGSFSSHARSHFWATIYEGLKQVVPWRSRKLKKDGLVI